MALSWDNAGSVVSSSTGNMQWSHTGAASGVRGVIVSIVQILQTNDQVVGVTYGSLGLTRVAGATVFRGGTEPGSVYTYVGTSGVPQGTQTVTVTVALGGSIKKARCFTILADSDLRVEDANTLSTSNTGGSTASVTVTSREGIAALAVGALHSSVNTVGGMSAGAGTSETEEIDLGNQCASFTRLTSPSSGGGINYSWGVNLNSAAGIGVVALVETAQEVELTEGLVLTDEMFWPKVTCTESLSLAHNVLRLAGIILLEALTLTDPTVAAEKTGGEKKFDGSETAALADTVARQVNWQRTLTEGVTLADVPQLGAAREIAQALTLADTFTRQAGRTCVLAETVDLTGPSDTWSHVSSCWPFEETSGTRHDSVGGVHLTEHESPGYATGVHGNAVDLDANSVQYLDNTTKSLNGLTKFSVSLWFAEAATPASRNHLFGTPNEDVSLQVRAADDSVYFLFGASIYAYTGANKITGTAYHHIVAVYDGGGATNPDRLKVWVDGVAESLTFVGSVPTTISATTGLSVGKVTGDYYVKGQLDELSYFEGWALSAADVAALWNDGAGAFYPPGEQLRKDVGRSAAETLPLADSSARALTAARTLLDAVVLTDAAVDAQKTGAKTKDLTEPLTLTASPTLGRTAARTLPEALTLADQTRRDAGLFPQESISLAASPTLGRTAARTFPETLALTAQAQRATSRALQQPTTLAASLQVGNKVDLTEALVLSPALSRVVNAQRVLSETAALSDPAVGATKNPGAKQLTETLALAHATLNLAGVILSETAHLSDSVTLPGQQVCVETLVLTDAVTIPGHYDKELTETVALADPVLVRERVLAEGITLSSVLSTSGFLDLPQSLQLADSVARQKGAVRNFTESLALTDAAVTTDLTHQGSFSKTLTETLGVADATTRSLAASRTLVENAGLADSFSRSSARARTLTESPVLTDPPVTTELSHQGTYQKDLPETLLITDSWARARTAARTLTEAATLSGAVQKDEARARTEVLSLADSRTLGRTAARTLTEGLALAEVISTQSSGALSLPAAVVLTDQVVFGRTAARTFTEGLTLTDARTRGVGRVLTQSLGAADAIRRDAARIVAQPLSLADARGRGVGRTLAQPLTLADQPQAAKQTAVALQESLALADGLRRDVAVVPTEALALAATPSRGVARSLADTAQLAGLFNSSKTGEANTIDVLNLVDSAQRSASRTLSEALDLADVHSSAVARELREALPLKDLVAQLAGGDRLQLAETLSLADEMVPPGVWVEPVSGLGETYGTTLADSQYHTHLTEVWEE